MLLWAVPVGRSERKDLQQVWYAFSQGDGCLPQIRDEHDARESFEESEGIEDGTHAMSVPQVRLRVHSILGGSHWSAERSTFMR